jgi:hypothetical protein
MRFISGLAAKPEIQQPAGIKTNRTEARCISNQVGSEMPTPSHRPLFAPRREFLRSMRNSHQEIA